MDRRWATIPIWEVGFPNAIFDESGNFLLYSTLLGVKVINSVTSRREDHRKS